MPLRLTSCLYSGRGGNTEASPREGHGAHACLRDRPLLVHRNRDTSLLRRLVLDARGVAVPMTYTPDCGHALFLAVALGQ
jgi:hypothetical protein